MNNLRRKAISALMEKLEVIYDELESITADEEEAFDNMPESLQESERGEKSQECIDNLNDVLSQIEDIKDLLDEVIN